MNTLSIITLFCLPFGVMALYMEFLEQEGENNILAILEDAHYHLDELQKRVNQFSLIQRRSARTKRDDRRAKEIQKSEFLFNSLINFCINIQNFEERTENSTSEDDTTWNTTTTEATTATTATTVTTTSTTDMTANTPETPTTTDTTTNTSETTATTDMTTNTSETTATTDTTTNAPETPATLKMNETEEDPWNFPKVRPLRVDAVKDGKQIHLLFHVNHSTLVEITRLAAFDMQKSVLADVDESKGMIQSLANFKVPTSDYCEEDYEIDNTFLFESISKPNNGVNLKIDVCGDNNRRQNQSMRFRRQALLHVISEDIRLPKFRIDSYTEDGVIVLPRINTTIDISVEPDTMSSMIVSGVFHDRAMKKMVKDEYQLDFNNGNVDIIRQMSQESPELFSVNVLYDTNTSINDTSEAMMQDDPGNRKNQVPISIILHTDSGQLAGKLYLEATNVHVKEDQRQLIQSVSVYHVIPVKKPGNRRVFPRRRVYIEEQSIFTCTEKGNQNHPKIGTHCTLSCSATGRGISDISIFKGNNSNGTIYQSLSYQISDRVLKVVDLGDYSPDINGWYVCSVTDGKGNQHTTDLLLNVGIPKIDVNNTSLIDLGNGTSLVICAIDGRPPMDVSVEIHYSPEQRVRVDDAVTSIRTQIEAKDEVLLTVALPTENVSYPANSVICIASSGLGYDNHSIDLPDVVTATMVYETQKPQILSKESKVINFDNGTTAVTCTATGATRLEAVVASANNSASFNLDDMPGHVRLQIPIDDGQSVTWYVDMENLIETSLWLYCVAMNSYGVDFFKLSTQNTLTDPGSP